jgi:hypothetical protein
VWDERNPGNASPIASNVPLAKPISSQKTAAPAREKPTRGDVSPQEYGSHLNPEAKISSKYSLLADASLGLIESASVPSKELVEEVAKEVQNRCLRLAQPHIVYLNHLVRQVSPTQGY